MAATTQAVSTDTKKKADDLASSTATATTATTSTSPILALSPHAVLAAYPKTRVALMMAEIESAKNYDKKGSELTPPEQARLRDVFRPLGNDPRSFVFKVKLTREIKDPNSPNTPPRVEYYTSQTEAIYEFWQYEPLNTLAEIDHDEARNGLIISQIHLSHNGMSVKQLDRYDNDRWVEIEDPKVELDNNRMLKISGKSMDHGCSIM